MIEHIFFVFNDFCVVADKFAVFIVNTFTYSDKTVTGFGINSLDFFHKPINVKVTLGNVNKIRTETFCCCNVTCRRKPAGMTSHNLYYKNTALVINFTVKGKFHTTRRDILGGACKTRTMVGKFQIVVYGFRHSYHSTRIVILGQKLAHLITGVHAVVSAVIQKVTDVVLFENFKNSAIIGVVDRRICKLVTNATQRRRRSGF